MADPRVVVVGGGFGGLHAARRLARGPVQVTLVDETGVHLFQPLLYQCATGLLSEGQISAPLRRLFRRHPNVQTLLGRAVDVDPHTQTVTVVRPDGSTTELPYDHLVIAAGVQQSYFGHDEYAAHAPGMKSLDDALTIRRRVVDAFEMAESLPDPQASAPWLTFVLVGAGPTGVELAGQIRELATHTLTNQYRSIDPSEARILLFDGGPGPLASFGPRLSSATARALGELGIELRTGSTVVHLDGKGVDVKGPDGNTRHVPARTVLWTAGVAAPPLATALARATGTEQDKAGRLKVQPDLRLPGHPTIFAVGDVISLDHLPGVAEVAMQSGHHAATQILAQLAGQPANTPFRYRDLGSAAYISRGRAVVKAGPLQLTGRLAWLLWGVIHLTFLASYRNRASALLTWTTTLALGWRRELVHPRRDTDSGRATLT